MADSNTPSAIRPKALPKDYVDAAEEIILSYVQQGGSCITTSKLRGLMTFTSSIYNNELRRTDARMSSESLSQVNQMRIRTAYEYGRDKGTKDFIEKTHLMQHLKWLAENHAQSRTEALDFARYMEALVAYHRFYGLDKSNKED